MVCLNRPYNFKFLKACLPQILLGPFLNKLTHILSIVISIKYRIVTHIVLNIFLLGTNFGYIFHSGFLLECYIIALLRTFSSHLLM